MHLTDGQLNEYLDNETTERAFIEAHLTECADCAARLTALQTLFTEIESLPEFELTHSLATRLPPVPSLPPQLPSWLTLTVTLQAVAALVAMVFTVPVITQYLMPIRQGIPSLKDISVELQSKIA